MRDEKMSVIFFDVGHKENCEVNFSDIYLKKSEQKIFLPMKIMKLPARTSGYRNPGLNQGPLDLQSNAPPTELFRLALGENY